MEIHIILRDTEDGQVELDMGLDPASSLTPAAINAVGIRALFNCLDTFVAGTTVIAMIENGQDPNALTAAIRRVNLADLNAVAATESDGGGA